ncbi:ABC transporter permease [Arsenicicoccus sp. oral taxon 190]|uniref:ABC transporter permease n=1 Tax=Arsenicicoccus sp. oral taxon 190 TaxID=1658671 RepID=UPI00067A0F4C|nr:ABC transporter permease [Arsenicicoccus sp. oral taxon 190]AKT52435.1 sugar ABC transporter permease [Arsenicicoccus sp. oral taxon 190]
MKFSPRAFLLALAAPLLAVLVAFVVTSLILLVAKDPVGAVWAELLRQPSPRLLARIINGGVVYYLAAVALAIGFRMNLFNIGAEGQYRIAVFAAAVFGAQGYLPGWANVVATLVVAMLVGAGWASIAAYLKVKRGISEVISSIMLNAIATSVVAFLLTKARDTSAGAGSNVTNTKPLPQDSWVPGLALVPGTTTKVYGLLVVALLVGVAYWLVLGKTRFGFDLRASGLSETAAVASGVDARRMVVTTMLLSGAVAGLIGMPLLFGQDHAYGTNFQPGIGFAGIGIALLGRNHPIGMGLAALLWSYLEQQGNALQIKAGVSDQLVAIIQGVIVLAVVIAYEIVRRTNVRLEQAKVARDLAAQSTPTAPTTQGASA